MNIPSSFFELDLQQQCGLVTDTLARGETFNTQRCEYIITRRNAKKITIKDLKSGKIGCINIYNNEYTSFENRNKPNPASKLFREIEEDIIMSLLDRNNPLGAIETESYKRAVKQYNSKISSTHNY